MNAAPSKPHGSYGKKSTLHSKVSSGAFGWNVNSASGGGVTGSGFMSMNDSGGSFEGSGSYFHVYFAGVGPARRPRSSARTSNVCRPGLRFRNSAGYSQSSHA